MAGKDSRRKQRFGKHSRRKQRFGKESRSTLDVPFSRSAKTRKSGVRKSNFRNSFPATNNEAPATLQPTPMLGSLVPMVPLAGVAASALESYSRFLVSGEPAAGGG